MKFLILFATVEGQTRKIAAFITKRLQEAGHDVEMTDIGDAAASVTFTGIDKAILAAPVHERRHPVPFEVFLAANGAALESVPTLLISVSLKAAFPECIEEAQDFLTEMKMRTGFSPASELLVAGAVNPRSYDYYAAQVMRQVLLHGREIDPSQEQEFTDWETLSKGIADFAGE